MNTIDGAPQLAFVDEYGDSRLATEDQSASTYFIITAVIVDGKNIETVRNEADRIRARHFQTGEMKSSSVAGNDQRRVKILNDLAKLDIHFYALAVDKREIRKDGGLAYKTSFLKFIHGALYNTLYRRYSDLAVVADQYGRPQFMADFIRYVEENSIPDLFRNSKFDFLPSDKEPLLQVADFFAGSLGRVFDPKKSTQQAKIFLEILEPKTLRIEEWPPKPRSIKPDILDKADSPHDSTIRNYCLNQAALFLEEHSSSKIEATQYQVEVLKHLLYVFRFVNSRKYVATWELKDALAELGLPSVDTHFLRSNVIAKLRDRGVILASSPQGYKLPIGVTDIRDFVEHGERIVMPMLNRIQSAREHILQMTKKEVDILNGDKYEKLRELLGNEGTRRKTE
ncbi:DUF3800 domain-containing protein [Melittangium boletus]|uniref:DUF3800 domain-containing protein n=1 Tax=Melittangium boletus TaxID=83453 RepID=UPI003DA64857